MSRRSLRGKRSRSGIRLENDCTEAQWREYWAETQGDFKVKCPGPLQTIVDRIHASNLQGWVVLTDPRGMHFISLAVKLDLRPSEVRALVDLNSTASMYSWEDLYRDARIRLEKVRKQVIMVHWCGGKAPAVLEGGGKQGSRSAVLYLQLHDQRLLDVANALMGVGRAEKVAANASSAMVGTVTDRALRSGVPAVHSSTASASAIGFVLPGRRPGSTVADQIEERHFTSVLFRGERSLAAESMLVELLQAMQANSDVAPLRRVLVRAFEDVKRSPLLVLTELIAPRNEDALCRVVLELADSIGRTRGKPTDELAPSSPIRLKRRKFLMGFLTALVQTKPFSFDGGRRQDFESVVAAPDGAWTFNFDSDDNASIASNESAGLPPGVPSRPLLLDGNIEEDEADTTEEMTIRDITAELNNFFVGRGHPAFLLHLASSFPRNNGTSLEVSLIQAAWERSHNERNRLMSLVREYVPNQLFDDRIAVLARGVPRALGIGDIPFSDGRHILDRLRQEKYAGLMDHLRDPIVTETDSCTTSLGIELEWGVRFMVEESRIGYFLRDEIAAQLSSGESPKLKIIAGWDAGKVAKSRKVGTIDYTGFWFAFPNAGIRARSGHCNLQTTIWNGGDSNTELCTHAKKDFEFLASPSTITLTNKVEVDVECIAYMPDLAALGHAHGLVGCSGQHCFPNSTVSKKIAATMSTETWDFCIMMPFNRWPDVLTKLTPGDDTLRALFGYTGEALLIDTHKSSQGFFHATATPGKSQLLNKVVALATANGNMTKISECFKQCSHISIRIVKKSPTYIKACVKGGDLVQTFLSDPAFHVKCPCGKHSFLHAWQSELLAEASALLHRAQSLFLETDLDKAKEQVTMFNAFFSTALDLLAAYEAPTGVEELASFEGAIMPSNLYNSSNMAVFIRGLLDNGVPPGIISDLSWECAVLILQRSYRSSHMAGGLLKEPNRTISQLQEMTRLSWDYRSKMAETKQGSEKKRAEANEKEMNRMQMLSESMSPDELREDGAIPDFYDLSRESSSIASAARSATDEALRHMTEEKPVRTSQVKHASGTLKSLMLYPKTAHAIRNRLTVTIQCGVGRSTDSAIKASVDFIGDPKDQIVVEIFDTSKVGEKGAKIKLLMPLDRISHITLVPNERAVVVDLLMQMQFKGHNGTKWGRGYHDDLTGGPAELRYGDTAKQSTRTVLYLVNPLSELPSSFTNVTTSAAHLIDLDPAPGDFNLALYNDAAAEAVLKGKKTTLGLPAIYDVEQGEDICRQRRAAVVSRFNRHLLGEWVFFRRCACCCNFVVLAPHGPNEGRWVLLEDGVGDTIPITEERLLDAPPHEDCEVAYSPFDMADENQANMLLSWLNNVAPNRGTSFFRALAKCRQIRMKMPPLGAEALESPDVDFDLTSEIAPAENVCPDCRVHLLPKNKRCSSCAKNARLVCERILKKLSEVLMLTAEQDTELKSVQGITFKSKKIFNDVGLTASTYGARCSHKPWLEARDRLEKLNTAVFNVQIS